MKFTLIREAQKCITEIRSYLLFEGPQKVLFNHLPKCGGASFKSYLRVQYPKRKIFSISGNSTVASVNQFKSYPEKKRYQYDLIEGHLAHDLSDYVHPECIKTTLFRDPIDRIISHYYYAKSNPNHYLHNELRSSMISLEAYVNSGLSWELKNWFTVCFSGLTLQESERHPKDAIAKAAAVITDNYDMVFFLDSLDSDIEQLKQKANFRFKYDGRKVNVTTNCPPVEKIPKSTLK